MRDGSTGLHKTSRPFIFLWKRFQMFLGSYDNSGWKGTQVVSSPISCSSKVGSEVAQGFIQSGPKSSKDGGCTASVGNLVHCCTVLMMKRFLLMSSVNHSCFKLCFMAVGILSYALQSKKQVRLSSPQASFP